MAAGGHSILVLCQFLLDYQYQYLINEVHTTVLTIADHPRSVRRSTWFGYLSNETWRWFGSTKGQDVDLSQVQDQGPATIDPTIMAEQYGIEMAPFPENWELSVGQEFTDAFLKELRSRP